MRSKFKFRTKKKSHSSPLLLLPHILNYPPHPWLKPQLHFTLVTPNKKHQPHFTKMNSKLLSFQPLSQSEGLWLCLHALGVIPGFGLGLAAPTISFQLLSCVTRVLSTAAHGKLYLGNKQPVADTADTVYSVGTALLSTVTPHLQQGLYPHRNPSQALQTHRSFPENPQDEQQMSSRSWMSQCLTPFAVRQLSHPESVVPAAPGELEAPVELTGNLCSSGQIHHSEGSDTPFSHLMDHLESSQLPITSQEQKQSPHTDTLAHGFSL